MLKDIKIKKITDVSEYDNKSTVEVALSVDAIDNKLYGITRRLDLYTEQSEINGWKSELTLKELDENFNIKNSTTIAKGEDPRMFIYKNKLCSLTWTWNPKKHDLDMHLIDHKEKIKIELINKDLNFNGKNWVPYVYNDELYFIYSLSPLIILKYEEPNIVILHKTEMQIEYLKKINWGIGIGELRAGTKGIQKDDKIYLFSRTASPGPHIIHFTEINLASYMQNSICIEPERKTGIHDPYGFFKFNNKYYISTTESDSLWSDKTKFFKNSIYLVENFGD